MAENAGKSEHGGASAAGGIFALVLGVVILVGLGALVALTY